MCGNMSDAYSYAATLNLRDSVQKFYENEEVKSALMRAQRRITTEGAILVEPLSGTELCVTVYHTRECVAREVGERLIHDLSEEIQKSQALP